MKSGLFTISQDAFQGPLDALLEMVQKRKLTIHDVSLAEVAEEFIAHVQSSIEDRPYEYITTGVVIAATLVLIKSRSLVPHAKLTADEEEDGHDLAAQLSRLQVFKKAARLIGELWLVTPIPITRSYDFPKSSIVFYADTQISTTSMHKAMLRTLSGVEAKKPTRTVKIKATLALGGMIQAMQGVLYKNTTIQLFSFLKKIRSNFKAGKLDTNNDITESLRVDIAIALCAALELVKMNKCEVTQTKEGLVEVTGI